MFSYYAHGIYIQSEICFPELEEYNSKADVIIEYGATDSTSKKVISEGTFRIATQYKITKESIFFIWNNIEILEIFNDKIIVNPHTNIEKSFLRALILGPGLGILLHIQDRLVLHASVIKINDSAVAFMGHNGAGKSTTTLSFLRRGYPLITDDIASVKFIDEVPWVFPGFPRIKLWPESIENNIESFPLRSESKKRSCHVDNFYNQIVPLKHVYIIENDNKTSLEPLTPQNKLIELIKNSYCANIFHECNQVSNLDTYSKIVKIVSIKQLNLEKNLEKIPEMVNLIENDIIY